MTGLQLAIALKGTGYVAMEGMDEDLYELYQVQGLDGQDLPSGNLIGDDMTAAEVLAEVARLTGK